jgi:assimilatory nitrate reductase catalytic subunit
LHEEEDGLGCSAEGRVIHWQKSVDPPANARRDSQIIVDLAHRLGRGQFFPFRTPAEILEEMRVASRGGVADYYGITYERVDEQKGIFWPCPSLDHPGTPILFADRKFYTHDAKAHFNVTEWRPSGDPVDNDFPIFLTSGRVVSQYPNATHRRLGRSISRTASGNSSAFG